MKTIVLSYVMAMISLLSLVGCGPTSSEAVPDIDARNFPFTEVVLSDEPAGAVSVVQLREQAENDEQVVMVGRIGGATNPWVEGRAAFVVVDPSIKLCNEGEGVCPCCQDEVRNATALVKIVDPDGLTYPCDARRLLQVEENAMVVIPGKAKRDDAGNLTVLTSGVYVRR